MGDPMQGTGGMGDPMQGTGGMGDPIQGTGGTVHGLGLLDCPGQCNIVRC